MYRAVLWDFGGVILSSPFEAFDRFEQLHGLPHNFLRAVNTNRPHDNAWARLERGEIDADQFDELFADESAALGHRVRGFDVIALLSGEVRPDMVDLLDRVIGAGYAVACLTNNIGGQHISAERSATIDAIMSRFDLVVESSKVGVRKPEPAFYEYACTALGVDPTECVFLDDLGINLKPAAAMGMTTIKVMSAEQAIADLEHTLWPDG